MTPEIIAISYWLFGFFSLWGFFTATVSRPVDWKVSVALAMLALCLAPLWPGVMLFRLGHKFAELT